MARSAKVAQRLAGLALIVLIVGVLTLVLMMYGGAFTSSATVFVQAPRSGLVLDPDAKVKLRGVDIGRVAEVDYDPDSVRLRLEINPDQLTYLPANVTVDIESTTVFGAKYVNFVVPQNPSSQPLRAGATVAATAVTVEFNTLFQKLSDILDKIDPVKLNATLSALGTALDGRGAQIGELLTASDEMLRELNPSLPALRRDLIATADVTDLYADTVPDLLRVTGNAEVTAGTLVDSATQLDAVLLSVIGLADTATPVLNDTEGPLSTALRLLRPTTGTLNEYRSALYCTIVGLSTGLPVISDMFGGDGPWVKFNASLMPAGEPYKYPQDLAKVNATGGPHCEGVLDRNQSVNANYLVTDTSEGHVFTPPTAPRPVSGTIFQLLFAGLPGM
ncbi:MCE family protein [Nocardia uniformis]|uniref:MCE family protein n=1 Tax=Nocardia uniformis TaxID=53432 RepID=A0A849BXJ7_9NOCA|nr:MCE family protein [Nocardia uniformis]NNH68417.1 MCE family protein [Nocardia uniformis]